MAMENDPHAVHEDGAAWLHSFFLQKAWKVPLSLE
jgi:hypothetical protein